jgi:two-component system, NarL family, sensor histidine kinase UhpB
MKYFTLVFTLVFLPVLNIKAQDDSLRTAFWAAKEPDERLRLAYEISKPLVTSHPDSLETYLFSALKDSASAGNSKHLASCLNLAAVHCYYKGKYDSMVHYARRATMVYVALNDSSSAVKPRKNIAIGLRVLGNYEEANSIFFEVLDYYKSINDSSSTAAILNDIGNTFSYLKDYQQSVGYQHEALGYLATSSNYQLTGNIFNSLGYNFYNIGERDSSVHYYEKSLEYKLKGGNIYSIINTRNNLCTSIEYKKEPERCLDCFRDLIKEQKQVGDMVGLARSFINMSVTYDYHDDCSNAISSLDSASHYLNFSDDIFLKQEYLSHYAKTLRKCGNITLAYSLQDSLLRLNDSIFEFQKRKALFDLDAKYQTRVKADSIQVLEVENTANLLKVKNQKWQISFLFILVISIVGAGGFTFYFFRQRQIMQRDLAIAQMREAERVRIARDMHDEIGSGLTRISLMGEQMKMLGSDKSSIARITNQSRALSRNLKEIIWAIDPKNDKMDELLFYMRDYIYELFADTEINTKLEFPEDLQEVAVGSEVRRNLFMAMKEILNNIIKHAEAGSVIVKFQMDENQEGRTEANRPNGVMHDRNNSGRVSFKVSDDGKGFDPSTVKMGVGLESIRSRIEKLGGEMVLETIPGKGTTIILKKILLNTTKG